MFRTKKDVDRHVQDVMRKLKNENERNLRCYNIAKLYYMVGEYELTRRYVSSYLTVREDSASAHKLLGQALENLGQKEKALAQYKCSLELESKQQDLVLKVCELLVDSEAPLDVCRARYWCERAEQLFPHHPTVFRLKEHLLTADGEEDAAELEALIASELTARPADVSLRVRLLRLYLDTERLTDAYKHAIEVENCAVPGFRDQLQWYDCLTDVFETYYEENSDKCDWEFFMHYVAVLERAAGLSLQEQLAGGCRGIADCVQALFSFDKILHQASNHTAPPSERDLFKEFLKHARGQLCLHLATLVMKKAKKERGNWREACRVSSPLLLLALSPPIDLQSTWLFQATETRKKNVDLWAKEAAYRNSQAGHVLLSMVHERKSQFLDKVTQFCSGNWRERVFQRIFTTRDHQQGMSNSHFVNFQGFAEPPLRLPTPPELLPHDEKSQKLYPGSLHHLVWLGLQDVSNSNKKYTNSKPGPDFRCQVFEGLQLTCNNLNVGGVETLNRLDVDAFLYAAVFCANASLEEQQAAGYWSFDRPRTLPANIMEQLCTVNQANWWTAAHRVYTNQAKGDLGELRQTLQRGIEVVRVLGNHGLDVKLIVQLARAFAERASTMAARTEGSNELSAIEARASLYWTSALPLLERLQRNQAIRAPHTRLFEYQGKELSTAEVNALIEEGRFFLACQLMKEDKHEKAIEAFQQLKSPDASFYQATIYKKLAAEELEDQRREMITSEMRSRHIILLTKARECYYLTLDRLRSPGVDAKHPLNAELNSHIEEIESQLSRIDPDVMLVGGDVNRNECDGMSDDSVSPAPSGGDNLNNSLAGLGNNSLYLQHSSLLHLTPRHRSSTGGHKHSSTPFRGNIRKIDSDIAAEHPRRTEARPSPERLDAQIRHLVHSKDTIMQTLIEQTKVMLEQNKAMVEGLRENKLYLEEIKNLIQELRKDTAKNRRQGLGGQSNLNADLSQVCDPEEDLYVFDDEDYSEDVNLAAAQLGQYQPFPPYPSYTNYRGMSSILGTPSGVGPYPAPHSGTQTPLLPPQPPLGGFFRGVDPSAASLMYPPALGYYAGQGALPFSEGQQLPNFASAAQGIPTQAATASIFSRLGGSADSPGGLHDPKLAGPPLVSQPLPPVAVAAAAAAAAAVVGVPPPSQTSHQVVAPVNVVITSSDTLPTSVPVNQPTLSVTIPPQHRLGTPLIAHQVAPLNVHSTTSAFTSTTVFNTTTTTTTQSSVPHAFQISMPPQAQLPQASLLEKGAACLSPVLPISTGMLLSSVPSPVYSALEKSPTTKEIVSGSVNVGGGDGRRISSGSAAGAEEEDGDEDGDHDPCPDFEPIIPLPAEIELTTGEEEENVLFESRAKLFRYVEKEWKERGVGVMKLLHNQRTGKVRALMRREQVLKICANHLLRSDMELSKMNDRAWMWVAMDFADDEMRLEKLCIRFKTSDEAANFKDAFDKAKLIAAATETPETSPVKSQSSSSSTITVSIVQEPAKTTPASTVPTTPSGNKITVGGFTFASPPTFKVDSNSSAAQSSKDAAKDKEKGAGEAVKASPFAGFSFTSPPKSSSSSDTVVSSITTVGEPAPLRRPRTTLPKPVVSAPATSTSTISMPSKSESEISQTESKPSDVFAPKYVVDSLNSSVTFSTTVGQGFKKDTNFKGWEGAGKSVFSSNKNNDPIDENEGGAEEFIPTAEFKPVIPLPELVELKTGEEGETILFEERSKLLRFDSEGKQWKERGIGKMKILQNSKSGKVRLLMRREQVLKVCCNHYLSKDTKFTMLATSDRAWTWYAQDFAEGEMKPELFAIKFKTTERAHAFKQALDKIQQKINEKGTVGEPVKSPLAVWKCKECLFPNASNAGRCYSCEKMRPHELKESNVFVPHGSDQQPKLMEISKSSDTVISGIKSSGSDPKPLSELFKPKAGSWECTSCLIRNEGTVELCVACGTPKPGSKTTPKSPAVTSTSFNFGVPKSNQSSVPLSELFKPKSGSWECKDCYTHNDANKFACACCTAPKPGHEGKQTSDAGMNKSSFQFGMPPAGGGFNLGTSQGTPQSEFSFGINQSGTSGTSDSVKFSFGISTTTSDNPTTSQSLFSSSAFDNKGEFTFGLPSVSAGQTASTTNIFNTETSSVNKPFSFQPKSTGAFLFGTSTSSGTGGTASSLTFSFGSSGDDSRKAIETTPTKDKDAQDHKFTFGSPGKFEFNFSGVRPKSPIKSPKSPGGGISASADDDESGSEPEEDEGEHIYFQPVIPLPDKVPLHTGEEQEDVLYCHRAKLFRYIGGEWKERGVGDVKLLKHKATQKIRLLMRRDQVLKLCLNHYLTPELRFREKDEKTWLWSAQDFSEGYLTEEKFALRFKNKDIATDFKQAIDKAQVEVKSSPKQSAVSSTSVTIPKDQVTSAATVEKGAGDGPVDISPAMKNFTFALPTASTAVQPHINPSSPIFSLSSQFGSSPAGGCVRSLFGGSSLPKPIPIVDLTSGKDELEVVYELKVTPEEEAAAARLKLPLNFYSYLRKPPCPGCEGCEPDTDNEADAVTLPVAAKGTATKSPLLKPSILFSTPTTSSTSASQKPTSITSGPKTSTIDTKSAPSSENATLRFGSMAVSTDTPQSSTPTLFGIQPLQSTIGLQQSTPQQITIFGGQTVPKTIQSVIASPKLSTINSPQTTLASIFSQPQSSVSFGAPIFGQTTTVSTSTSLFSQQAQSNSFSSIDSGLKPVFSNQTTGSGFMSVESKSSPALLDTNKLPAFSASASVSNLSVTQAETPKPFSALGLKPAVVPTPDADGTNVSSFNFTNSSTAAITKPTGFSFSGPSSGSTNTSEVLQPKELEGVPFPLDSSLGDEGGVDDSTTSAHDPHFEPIIDLPDAIEVRTGEEDETIMFCSRAKLFRYETSTKEWKERGIGEMKILHHPVNNTYRLLLRREQVHKVVCNLLLNPGFSLKPLNTSDRAWCFGALNYAEESEPKIEELAVKFKSPEIAKEFSDKVQSYVEVLRASAVSITLKSPEGLGDLQIVYDPDIFVARISVEEDGTSNQLCNTLIALNTTLEVKKRDCIWSGVDYAVDPPVQKTFKAVFSSEEAASEFEKIFQEGIDLAEQAELVEHSNPAELSPDED
ncbi:hypothetical protein C0J52_03693 [Blattella germanica]|nr:hypothetical protein C0J52_03693 [Blattella germanica]